MKPDSPDISFILPAYNEEKNISLIYSGIKKNLPPKTSFEILFIDDGSSDQTLTEIKSLAKKDTQVKYLSFSKNFGHQIALKAGLDYVTGRCVISLDCDLQHPPELIPKLLTWWHQGYDIVYTTRQEKESSWFKAKAAAVFYWLMRLVSDVSLETGAADYRLLDRKVVDQLIKVEESALFLRGIVKWVGFNQKAISYIPNPRLHGRSKYSFSKMIGLALNGITSFSVKPLRISMIFGLIISAIAGIYGVYAIIARFQGNATITGWTSVILSVLFLGGIQLITLGIMGEYIGKIFMEVKHRPLYIIKEKSL